MKHVMLAAIAALAVAVPARADLKVTENTTGKGLGLTGNISSTTYIKGLKMRVDTMRGDKVESMIFDVANQKLYSFDSKKKEADVWDMAAFAAELGKSVDTSSTKASLKPNGQTKQIGGRAADGYDMEISMAAGLGGSKDMIMTVTLQGPVWIVKNAPGAADYGRFFKAAAEKGWIFGDPRAAKAQPGQARATAEMYKQLADTGGIAYETDMQIKLSGSGPMAGLFAKMGNVSMLTVVDSVDAAALPDDLFAPPAGYKVSPKK